MNEIWDIFLLTFCILNLVIGFVEKYYFKKVDEAIWHTLIGLLLFMAYVY